MVSWTRLSASAGSGSPRTKRIRPWPPSRTRQQGLLLGVAFTPPPKPVACQPVGIVGIEFGFHPLDERRNPRGGSPVPYWAVDSVDVVRGRLLDAGCVHHRGPLDVGDGSGRRIAQVRDPFGNVIGIDGF